MGNPSSSRIFLFADPSTRPEEVAQALALDFEIHLISRGDVAEMPNLANKLLAIFLVSAESGISQEMIALWRYCSERFIPRMFLVNRLEFSEADFDDIVLIINRTCEEVITPYLVLHDELSQPIALISLDKMEIHDYSESRPRIYQAESELRDLVVDFQKEYRDLIENAGENAIENGLASLALPISESRGIGLNEVKDYINLITSAQPTHHEFD